MRLAIVILLLLGLPACGPLVTIPGGELSGKVQSAPSDWSFSEDFKIVQLETRPADPYSVNIYVVAVGSDIYIAASKPDNQEMAGLAETPRPGIAAPNQRIAPTSAESSPGLNNSKLLWA